jgi:pyruvate/2-oxoglutarate dehydrogenase complex dihydrolipoamide acyltransferase (E2) component
MYRIRLAAGMGAVVLALGACSGGGDDSAQVADDGGAEAASATTGLTATRAASPAPSADTAAEQQTAPVAVGEALAITARATVRAEDVQAAVDRISSTVSAHGGRVTAADVHHAATGDDSNGSRATLVLAVPPDQLAAVRGALDDVGEVLSYEQEAQDVAKQLTDLASRITNRISRRSCVSRPS